MFKFIYFQNQNLSISLYVIEQAGEAPFNRGKLFNVGIQYMMIEQAGEAPFNRCKLFNVGTVYTIQYMMMLQQLYQQQYFYQRQQQPKAILVYSSISVISVEMVILFKYS